MRSSIAITNYNYGRYLRDALDSALGQSRPADQVIVVDDGSTDDSREILAEYEGRVETIMQDNVGVSTATNRAIAACTGDVVLLLDADDLMEPDRVLKVMQLYEAHPQIQWLFHPLRYIARDTGMSIEGPQWKDFAPGLQDHRAAALRGRLGIGTPATSGLTWRRDFLLKLLPIPSVAPAQDSYLKFASLALGIGYIHEEALSVQGIHGKNVHTGKSRQDQQHFWARSNIAMATGYSKLHILLQPIADRLIGDAIAYSQVGASLTPFQRQQLRAYLTSVSPRRRIRIALRAGRTELSQLVQGFRLRENPR